MAATIEPEIVAASDTALRVTVPNIPSLPPTRQGPLTAQDDREEAKYSPDEWELRMRGGILSTALRQYRRHSVAVPRPHLSANGQQHRKASAQHRRRRISVLDSSDEEYRYGILGKSLEKRRKRLSRDYHQQNGPLITGTATGGTPTSSEDSGLWTAQIKIYSPLF